LVAIRPLGPFSLRKLLSRARNRESAIVQKLFDSKDVLDILLLIYAVAGLGFFRGKIRKLGFPKPQDVRLDTYDFANLTYFEEELVRNFL
jgi:hypothetical protein